MSRRVVGVITEVLPNDLYSVELESGRTVVAHIAGKQRMNIVRLIPGDDVAVEISAFDRNKARVLAKGS
ncbi:translation initiation factor IF-1 [Planctomycetota bacterium]